MATFVAGEIEAYVGPTELGASDDLESVIVEFISKAKDSLEKYVTTSHGRSRGMGTRTRVGR